MATTAATTTWTADTVHSTANFAVRHMVVATFRGAFTDVTGSLDLAEQPRLVGEVDVASIQVKDENLYGHLQSAEFFDAATTPKITFVSDSVVRDGDDVTLEGDLTIKGVTKPVTLRVTSFQNIKHPMLQKDAIGANATVTVKRSDFNAGKYAPNVGDEVTIDIPVEAILQ